MITHAQYYARCGWAVLPLHWIEDGHCSCGRDCGSAGKHPLLDHGLREASSALTYVELWWDRWPKANIGIATGIVSGMLVLDVDGPPGRASLASRRVPDTVRAETGKGAHYYFAHPDRCAVPNLVGFVPGLDLRADGGYVVAPPSVHASGKIYAWADGAAPGEIELAQAPRWIYSAVFARRNTDRRFFRPWRGRRFDPRAVPAISSGERNRRLTSIVGRLCYERRPQAEAESLLLQINAQNCRPPLDEREVRRVVRSIYGRYYR